MSVLTGPPRLADWIEDRIIVPQGPLRGQPMRLTPWQRRFCDAAFRPGVVETSLSVGRSNGKSMILAAIATAHLAGPWRQPLAEIGTISVDFPAGRRLFRLIAAMLRGVVGPDIDNRKLWREVNSGQRGEIRHVPSDAWLRVYASGSEAVNGSAAMLWLCDEAAQWTDRGATIETVRTGEGKLGGENERILIASTRAESSEHWFEAALRGVSDRSFLYAAAEDAPPFRKRTIERANPSARAWPHLLEAIRRHAERAKTDPLSLRSYRARRLNQPLALEDEAHLLEADVWQDLEDLDGARNGPPIWGVDLAESEALAAVVALWEPPEGGAGRLEAVAALPADPGPAERGRRDGVADRYERMRRRGELVVLGQHETDVTALLEEALRRFGPPKAIACDTWKQRRLREARTKIAALAHVPIVVRRSRLQEGHDDLQAFLGLCTGRRVAPERSDLMRACVAEARYTVDRAGNYFLARRVEGGRRMRGRDDGVAAAIVAAGEAQRRWLGPRDRGADVGFITAAD